MSKKECALIKAYREDHAVLGRGFTSLSAALRGGRISLACEIARTLDVAAGPHIAFEEKDFYPRLAQRLGESELARLYGEHEAGLAVIERLLTLARNGGLDEASLAQLIARSEAMEQHIAECAELFQAMAALPADEQARLLDRLRRWREAQPSWRDLKAQSNR